MSTHATAQALISALPDGKPDELFPLVDGALVVEELTSRRPHGTALHRWAKRGIGGVRLQTVTVGRARYTTRRWLLTWFAAVDQVVRESGGRASEGSEVGQ